MHNWTRTLGLFQTRDLKPLLLEKDGQSSLHKVLETNFSQVIFSVLGLSVNERAIPKRE